MNEFKTLHYIYMCELFLYHFYFLKQIPLVISNSGKEMKVVCIHREALF